MEKVVNDPWIIQLTWVNIAEAVLQDKQGTSEIGLCQFEAAAEAIYTSKQFNMACQHKSNISSLNHLSKCNLLM